MKKKIIIAILLLFLSFLSFIFFRTPSPKCFYGNCENGIGGMLLFADETIYSDESK